MDVRERGDGGDEGYAVCEVPVGGVRGDAGNLVMMGSGQLIRSLLPHDLIGTYRPVRSA